ncbi:multidrug resistance-associated 4-like, partial [Paramuricea clavata]
YCCGSFEFTKWNAADLDNASACMTRPETIILIFIWWIFPLLWKGVRNPLNHEDLYPIREVDKSGQRTNLLEEKWCEEILSARSLGREPKLWRAILKYYTLQEYLFFKVTLQELLIRHIFTNKIWLQVELPNNHNFALMPIPTLLKSLLINMNRLIMIWPDCPKSLRTYPVMNIFANILCHMSPLNLLHPHILLVLLEAHDDVFDPTITGMPIINYFCRLEVHHSNRFNKTRKTTKTSTDYQHQRHGLAVQASHSGIARRNKNPVAEKAIAELEARLRREATCYVKVTLQEVENFLTPSQNVLTVATLITSCKSIRAFRHLGYAFNMHTSQYSINFLLQTKRCCNESPTVFDRVESSRVSGFTRVESSRVDLLSEIIPVNHKCNVLRLNSPSQRSGLKPGARLKDSCIHQSIVSCGTVVRLINKMFQTINLSTITFSSYSSSHQVRNTITEKFERFLKYFHLNFELRLRCMQSKRFVCLSSHTKGKDSKPKFFRDDRLTSRTERKTMPVFANFDQLHYKSKKVSVKTPLVCTETYTSIEEQKHLQNKALHELTRICGPVGSGKSSLLSTVLGGELLVTNGFVKYSGTLAYVSDTPWVFSGTIRENILFGLPYNEKLYAEVITACQLEKDFKTFPQNDLALIGEHGATVSGGQRTRIALARATYSQADIYLLDDPLSSLDVNVAENVFRL